MKLTCVNCGTAIPADKINIQETLAVCPNCDTIFRFDKDMVQTVARPKRRKLSKPQKLQVYENDNTVQIRYRWIKDLNSLFISIGILFAVFTVILAAIGFAIIGEGEPLTLVIGSGFLLGALLCAYMFATIPLNSTVITLDDETLAQTEEPLYGFDNHQITRGDVRQIEIRPAGSDGILDGYSNLVAVLYNGSERKLASYLKDDYAAYIAQVLNEYLEVEMAHDTPFIDDEMDEGIETPAALSDLLTDSGAVDTTHSDESETMQRRTR